MDYDEQHNQTLNWKLLFSGLNTAETNSSVEKEKFINENIEKINKWKYITHNTDNECLSVRCRLDRYNGIDVECNYINVDTNEMENIVRAYFSINFKNENNQWSKYLILHQFVKDDNVFKHKNALLGLATVKTFITYLVERGLIEKENTSIELFVCSHSKKLLEYYKKNFSAEIIDTSDEQLYKLSTTNLNSLVSCN